MRVKASVARRRGAGALLLWAVLGLFGLGGCGFHLRGQYTLPEQMQTTYIKGSSPYQALVTDIRLGLRSAGVEVVDSAEKAGAVLRVLRERFDRRVVAFDRNGKVLEYELLYQVRMDVVPASGGKAVVPPQEFAVLRQFFDNQTDALGRFEEENILREEMRRDVTDLILLHLATYRG